MDSLTVKTKRKSTGIPGLDEIMFGGLISNQTYLVRGGPGTGKTTLGLHFLNAGVAANEKALYISLGESSQQIKLNAAELGMATDAIDFLDLGTKSNYINEAQAYDIFKPSEVEGEPTNNKIIESVEGIKPTRIFLDSITNMRYLSNDAYQFRKNVLSLLSFLAEQGVTSLLASEGTANMPDDDLQFMCDGVINLNFSSSNRFVNISKFRGSDFRSGDHSTVLGSNGMQVFPKLLPQHFSRHYETETLPSGIPGIDELLHGGLERGTITILSGPTGVGKTTVGLQFMKEAAGRGEKSVVFTFEETKANLFRRCEGVNIPLKAMEQRGTLKIMQIEPLLYSPDQFANMVREEVEQHEASIVMLDSISGYQISHRGTDTVVHLHALCKYMQNMGLAVLLVNEITNISGEFRVSDIGVSYMADNIIFLRYLELQGELRRAIGVLKKRTTDFEKTLRELEITRYGIKVGKPLTELRGILTGTPEWLSPSN